MWAAAEVRLRAGSPPQLLPLIQTRRLRFFGHVARMGDSQDTPRALYTSIRGLPEDWRRRPGRPRRTWLRTLEADLQPLNHGLNSAWRLAQDRGRWKQLVETATLQPGARPRWWWCMERYLAKVTLLKRLFNRLVDGRCFLVWNPLPTFLFPDFFHVYSGPSYRTLHGRTVFTVDIVWQCCHRFFSVCFWASSVVFFFTASARVSG